MKQWQAYLERQKPEYLQTRLPRDISAGMVVVIPCYNEQDELITLQSLCDCTLPDEGVIVAVIINSSVVSPHEALLRNRTTFNEITSFASKTTEIPSGSFR